MISSTDRTSKSSSKHSGAIGYILATHPLRGLFVHLPKITVCSITCETITPVVHSGTSLNFGPTQTLIATQHMRVTALRTFSARRVHFKTVMHQRSAMNHICATMRPHAVSITFTGWTSIGSAIRLFVATIYCWRTSVSVIDALMLIALCTLCFIWSWCCLSFTVS
jgi:hypothetical protein